MIRPFFLALVLGTASCTPIEPVRRFDAIRTSREWLADKQNCLHLRGGEGSVTLPREAVLLCTDLDDTLVGDKEALAKFNTMWKGLAEKGGKLVYNTGRSFKDYEELKSSWELLQPDVFIGGCGSQMFTFNDGNAAPVAAWTENLEKGWSKAAVMAAVKSSAVLRQRYGEIIEKRESQGNEFMFSMRLPDTGAALSQVKSDFASAIEEGAETAGLKFQICVASVAYTAGSTVTKSGGEADGDRCVFLDVLPEAAGKGQALTFASERLLSVPADRCIVAGDSGNDVPMFQGGRGERGIMVGNSKAELVAVLDPSAHYHAAARNAAGIVEGLQHFGVVAAEPAPAPV